MIKVLKTKRVLEKGTLIAKQVMLLTSKLETGELKQLESNFKIWNELRTSVD